MASKRRTAFVPRIVLSTVFLGVVPACVIACSSDDGGGKTVTQGVAADAFSVGAAFVAETGFIALADIGFIDTASPDDAASDATEAGDAAGDAPLGVAADGFSG